MSDSSVRDCPFRDGKCIGRECMLWIGTLDEETKEDVGHCVLVKDFTESDTRLSCIIALLIIIMFLIIFF